MKLFEVIHILYGTAVTSRENLKWFILLRVLCLCAAIDDVNHSFKGIELSCSNPFLE